MEEKRVAVLVDDDELVRRVVKRELRGDGYSVFEAKDGQELIENLSDYGKVDLFVIDCEMPRKDGPTTILELRRMDDEFSLVKIVGRSSIPDEMQRHTLKLLENELLSTENLRFMLKPGKVNASEIFSQPRSSIECLVAQMCVQKERISQFSAKVEQAKFLTICEEVLPASPEKSPSISHSPIRKCSE